MTSLEAGILVSGQLLTARPVLLEETLKLRDVALSPGHPGRPVIWPYDSDTGARNHGAFLDGRLVACVSASPKDFMDGLSQRSFRFHSMGVEPAHQGFGVGTFLLRELLKVLLEEDEAEFVWATARESAIGFYRRFGMHISEEETVVPESGFPLRYITCDGELLRRLAA